LIFLDSQGYGYYVKRKVMRVCKCALIVMKRKLINGFYHLQGLTVIDLTSVSSLIYSNSVSTQLKRMQLWHISEKGMIELSKQDLLYG
jgi:hypothetical protein